MKQENWEDQAGRMVRPAWYEIAGQNKQCSCGQLLLNDYILRQHWQNGHFDKPILDTKHLLREAIEEAVDICFTEHETYIKSAMLQVGQDLKTTSIQMIKARKYIKSNLLKKWGVDEEK